MRRIALSFALLGVLIAPLTPAASQSTRPALRVLDKAPLILSGTGFKPAERVKVTVVTQPAQLVRRASASRFGTFRVQFDTMVDPCYGARAARVVGTRGSKASIVLARPLQRSCVEPGGAP